MKKSLKSTPPRSLPIGGIRTSLTSEVTMVPKAAPMITPTARSTTFPRMMNVLNSLSIAPLLPAVRCVRRPKSARAQLYNGPQESASGRGAELAADYVRVRGSALEGAVPQGRRERGLEVRAHPVQNLLGDEPERNAEDHAVRDQVLQSHRPSSSAFVYRTRHASSDDGEIPRFCAGGPAGHRANRPIARQARPSRSLVSSRLSRLETVCELWRSWR